MKALLIQVVISSRVMMVMADVFTKEKRSEVMSLIRSESKIEKEFCRLLSKEIYPMGYRYRRNYKRVPGKPDIAFVSKKIAIFIDGDFWHGYRYKNKMDKLPAFWRKKIETNMKRDQKNSRLLKKMGWTYIRFWEHEIRKNKMQCLEKIKKAL